MIIVVGGRSASWNSIYSQNSYWKRKLMADGIHGAVQASLLEMGILPNRDKNLFKNKVDIDIRAYFKNRLLDSDNIPAKLICDSLKGYILIDDTPKFVGRVSTESLVGTTERIEIEILERANEA